MPRQPRLDIPGALYHVIVRGIERRAIFHDQRDKAGFLERFGNLVVDCRLLCYAWALLTNHIHLLVSPTSCALSLFMHRLLTGYAVTFNHRYTRSGYLFQSRYRAILCQREAYFQQLVKYIHRNPLRAGLVETLDELDRYPRCGHAALMGNIPYSWQAVEETLRHFGSRPQRAKLAYRKHLEDIQNAEDGDRYEGGGLIRSAGDRDIAKALLASRFSYSRDERILGDGDFVKDMLRRREEQDIQKRRLISEGWNYEKIVEYVCGRTGVEASKISIKCKGQKGAQARALVAYLCHRWLGMRVTQIAGFLGVSQPAASQLIQKGRPAGEDIRMGME